MNLKQLFAFMLLVCGVLSANAQSEDKAMDLANGDSVSNVASVSEETIGFGGKHNRIKMDYNFGWYLSRFIDKNSKSHTGIFGTGISLSYEHIFRAGYGFGIHGILERRGCMTNNDKEIITGYIGPSLIYAKSKNSWSYSSSVGVGFGRFSIDDPRFYHEDRSGVGIFYQIEGEKRFTKWFGLGAGLRVIDIIVKRPDGFDGLRYGTSSLRFTLGPRFYF